jgi:hypothetical protein
MENYNGTRIAIQAYLKHYVAPTEMSEYTFYTFIGDSGTTSVIITPIEYFEVTNITLREDNLPFHSIMPDGFTKTFHDSYDYDGTPDEAKQELLDLGMKIHRKFVTHMMEIHRVNETNMIFEYPYEQSTGKFKVPVEPSAYSYHLFKGWDNAVYADFCPVEYYEKNGYSIPHTIDISSIVPEGVTLNHNNVYQLNVSTIEEAEKKLLQHGFIQHKELQEYMENA